MRMKERLFRKISVLGLGVLLWGMSAGGVMAGDIDTDTMLIESFYEKLDEKDYEGRADLAAGEYYELLTDMYQNEYYSENNIGFYNVESVDNVVVLGEVPDNGYSYSYVWESVKETSSDVTAYLVKSDVVAKEITDFYYTGTRYDVLFVGTVEQERKIVSMNTALRNLVDEYVGGRSDGLASSYSLNINSRACIPDEIKVKMSDGTISTVDFKTYCKRVAAQEVGYDSRPVAYHKSGCIALKNFAMYRYLTAGPDAGSHIGADTGTQVYIPDINYNGWPNLMNAMDQTWHIFMMDASGNCFESGYRSGDDPEHSQYDHEHSGIMLQNKAKTMAENGKTYQEILEYYYAYSSVTNNGAVYYKTLEEHNYQNTGSHYTCYRCGHMKPY